jgi:S-adenosylmethionine synthetase
MGVSYLFTSESVTEGHPDKVSDQISDAILDKILYKDRNAKCAIETIVKSNTCIVTGEITSWASIDIRKVIYSTLKKIGYTCFDYEIGDFVQNILILINKQSQNIEVGVNKLNSRSLGAGDQGIMFGYACNETKELMPMSLICAHQLTKRLSEIRKSNLISWLRPDGKSQVSISYESGKPSFIKNIIISTQHSPSIPLSILREVIIEEVIKKIEYYSMVSNFTEYYINSAGNFVIGGPVCDSGLSGRKIIVDSYGGCGVHGGGSFSGKDPSKVDRSGAYMSRYIAKNIVAAKIASRCEIQLSYIIGDPNPLGVTINTFNTSKISDEKIVKVIKALFPLNLMGIINHLDLLKPIYEKTAVYGHFGRINEDFSWEKIDMVKKLQRIL